MPHVDEGTLHAYLDGAIDALVDAGALPHGTTRDSIDAHLAMCTDCRALLEAERTVRARAGAVLADIAIPAVDVPPFAQLGATPRLRPPRRTWPLAWAASVLIAGSAGWWGSMMFRDSASMRSASELAAPGASSDVALPSPVMPQAEQAQARVNEAATELRRDGEQGNVTLDAVMPPSTPARSERSEDAANVGAAAADRERVAGARLRDIPQALQGQSALQLNPLQQQQQVAPQQQQQVAPQQQQVAAVPPPPAMQRRMYRDSGGAATVFESAELVPAQLERFRQDLSELAAGRIVLSTAPAPGELPLLQLRGGDEPRVEHGVASPGHVLARITQRTTTGIDVELIVWRESLQPPRSAFALTVRPEAQRAAVPERDVQAKSVAALTPHAIVSSGMLRDGRRELQLRLSEENVLVAVRAPVTDAELRDLVAQLEIVRRD